MNKQFLLMLGLVVVSGSVVYAAEGSSEKEEKTTVVEQTQAPSDDSSAQSNEQEPVEAADTKDSENKEEQNAIARAWFATTGAAGAAVSAVWGKTKATGSFAFGMVSPVEHYNLFAELWSPAEDATRTDALMAHKAPIAMYIVAGTAVVAYQFRDKLAKLWNATKRKAQAAYEA